MAGVTNTVFRRICKEKGVDVVTTEFVSAEGIFHRNERTRRYLEFSEEERPVGVQLFGADPDHLAEAARKVVEWVQPDFIDINFGCPVNKVVCRNGGSALLKDVPLLAQVASAVVKGVAPLPVTAKIRLGWDACTINAAETSRILESVGIRRVTVHGRTRKQGYAGEADWDEIGRVVQAVKIPVIGNGDISNGAIAVRRVRETGVKGLMIGRAAMANPWIFEEVRHALEGGKDWVEPTLRDRWQLIIRHCREEVAWRGDENTAMRSMRARLMAYTRGMIGGKELRGKLQFVECVEQIEEIAQAHWEEMGS